MWSTYNSIKHVQLYFTNSNLSMHISFSLEFIGFAIRGDTHVLHSLIITFAKKKNTKIKQKYLLLTCFVNWKSYLQIAIFFF